MVIPNADWDEEEYAEQIRLNRWTQLHKQAIPTKPNPSAPPAADTAQRAARVLVQQWKRQQQRLEAERNQQAEYRNNYTRAWKALSSTNQLKFTSFPWPIYPPLPLPPLSFPSPQQLAIPLIRRFLQDFVDVPSTGPAKRSNSTADPALSTATLSTPSHGDSTTTKSATKSLKSMIRSTLLLYHPDRFAPLLDRVSDPSTRDRVAGLANLATENLSMLLKDVTKEEKEELERQQGDGVLEEESERRRRKRRKESDREDWDESARAWNEDSD